MKNNKNKHFLRICKIVMSLVLLSSCSSVQVANNGLFDVYSNSHNGFYGNIIPADLILRKPRNIYEFHFSMWPVVFLGTYSINNDTLRLFPKCVVEIDSTDVFFNKVDLDDKDWWQRATIPSTFIIAKDKIIDVTDVGEYVPSLKEKSSDSMNYRLGDLEKVK